MAKNDDNYLSEDVRAEHIYVNSYFNKQMVGELHSAMNRGQEFTNVMQLLKLMGRSMEESGVPEAYDRIRYFSQPPLADSFEEPVEPEVNKRGLLSTFVVKVLFRQNSSWQGIIRWEEGKREETFRSTYEMLMLMDSALEAASRSL